MCNLIKDYKGVRRLEMTQIPKGSGRFLPTVKSQPTSVMLLSHSSKATSAFSFSGTQSVSSYDLTSYIKITVTARNLGETNIS